MSKGFSLDDYVDVSERIASFYARYPDGRLVMGSHPQVVQIGDRPFIWYHARAYRTPDDPLPGDGWAAEPVPGSTPYTRESELMNAETAAWGRAIVSLGFETKKIASKQEVQNRQSPSRAKSEPKPPIEESVEKVACLSQLLREAGYGDGQVAEALERWRVEHGGPLTDAELDGYIKKAESLVRSVKNKAAA